MTGLALRPRRSRWLLLAALLLLLAWSIEGTSTARANGVPTLVSLAYINGLSNWGPEDATGALELSFAEGYARLQASGMTTLIDRQYQGWLVNSESNDAISIGRFDAGPSGEIAFEGVLPSITDFGFDLFIITVEPDPDDVPQPAAERSIGGYFSLVGDPSGDGTLPADVSTQPGELPNTGDPTFITDIGRIVLLLAVMALALFIGLRLGRRTA